MEETKVVNVKRSEEAKKRVIEGFMLKNFTIRRLEKENELLKTIAMEAQICSKRFGKISKRTWPEKRLMEALLAYNTYRFERVIK